MGKVKIWGSIIKIVLICVVALLALGFVGHYTGLLSKIGLNFGKPLEIDKTANVVSEIKKISEFTTTVFYDECALLENHYKVQEKMVYKKSSTGSLLKDALRMGKEAEGVVRDSTISGRIAVLVHGKARAGFDLSLMGENDIMVKGDTLYARLPKAEFFDVVVNPSDVEIFFSSGTWEDDEVAAILARAKDQIEKDAMENNILTRAETVGRDKFASLFKSFGFEEVVFIHN